MMDATTFGSSTTKCETENMPLPLKKKRKEKNIFFRILHILFFLNVIYVRNTESLRYQMLGVIFIIAFIV